LIAFFFIACKQKGNEEQATATPSAFQWKNTRPESQGMSSQKLDEMKNVLAKKGTKKLLIIKNNKVVYEWFASGWEDSARKHYSASLAKALVGGMSLLTAMDDSYITLDEPAFNYIPQWKKNGLKSTITIRHLATHTSGIEDAEASEEEKKEMTNGSDKHMELPGWKGQFWRQEPDPFLMARDSAPVIFTTGTKYAYSNPGIAMLTYAVTASLKDSPYSDVRTYLKERIYEPVGIDEKEYSIGYGKIFTAGNLQLVPSWGGGSFTANAVGRIGLLMLHKGNWQGKQIINSSAVEKVTRYWDTALPTGSAGYSGNTRNANNPVPATTAGWYSNFDGVWSHVPRDAFAGGGAGNQHLFVIPSLNMVIVRMGDNLYDESDGEGFWKGAEKYLLNPIMDAIEKSPYPKSDFSLEFIHKDSVIRMAKGSDCWPATWADDGDLYTAYGDGWGFLPYVDTKLSNGLAKVAGHPPGIKGFNIRSGTGEKVGQGKYGEKASGMLMVDGVLYMLVRNAQNAALMWSYNHGKNWEQANWKFDISFGYPTFLNYEKNYEGAKDDYIYVYSHDEASAYKNSDRFVLARVPKNQIKNWHKYEYFVGYETGNNPKWSEDIRKRESVFTNPGKCYRSGITYNKGLKRYLWCQTIQMSPPEGHAFNGGQSDVRFRGGLGIFESPNPWGPWKTVYYTRNWDIGPGETSSIPAKWMSDDGKTAYLLFSGDDYFSIRKLTFTKN
jgi:CubicO group peptidase (beta-lactamase class C family)